MYIMENDKVVNIACEHLEPVAPTKHEKVKCLAFGSVLY